MKTVIENTEIIDKVTNYIWWLTKQSESELGTAAIYWLESELLQAGITQEQLDKLARIVR